jgi:hypothetical protein
MMFANVEQISDFTVYKGTADPDRPVGERRQVEMGGARQPASDPLQRAGAASLVTALLYSTPVVKLLTDVSMGKGAQRGWSPASYQVGIAAPSYRSYL